MKYLQHIPTTKHVGFNHKINEIGLKKAYNTHKGIHIDNDTMFIAGTRNFRDVYDDVTKIPVWGDLKNSKRYRDVEEEIKENPNVKKLVGHSLAGSVALEFEKNNKGYETTTYGAPVFGGLEGGERRYRHRNDPISAFDFGAKSVGFSFNPLTAHSYQNY